MAPSDCGWWTEDEAFVGTEHDALARRRVTARGGRDGREKRPRLVCPCREREPLRRAAEVTRDQQTFVAVATLIGEDVRSGTETIEERDVANRQRGMSAAEREQAPVQKERRTGRAREALDVAIRPVGVQWKP